MSNQNVYLFYNFFPPSQDSEGVGSYENYRIVYGNDEESSFLKYCSYISVNPDRFERKGYGNGLRWVIEDGWYEIKCYKLP